VSGGKKDACKKKRNYFARERRRQGKLKSKEATVLFARVRAKKPGTCHQRITAPANKKKINSSRSRLIGKVESTDNHH